MITTVLETDQTLDPVEIKPGETIYIRVKLTSMYGVVKEADVRVLAGSAGVGVSITDVNNNDTELSHAWGGWIMMEPKETK